MFVFQNRGIVFDMYIPYRYVSYRIVTTHLQTFRKNFNHAAHRNAILFTILIQKTPVRAAHIVRIDDTSNIAKIMRRFWFPKLFDKFRRCTQDLTEVG